MFCICPHLKRRWSDSGDCLLGVDSHQGDYFKTVLLIRDDVHSKSESDSDTDGRTTATGRQRQDDGNRTAATGRRRQDDGDRTAARQRRRWRWKKPAADLVISILPAMLFHFIFYFFPQKFYFLTHTRARVIFDTLSHQQLKIDSKISFLHDLRSLRDILTQFWILNFWIFSKNVFCFFSSKFPNWGTG